jgi:hypothetical protein
MVAMGIFLWGKSGRRVRLTTLQSSVYRVSRKCGTLDFSQFYGSLRPVSGIALSLFYGKHITHSNSNKKFCEELIACFFNTTLVT